MTEVWKAYLVRFGEEPEDPTRLMKFSKKEASVRSLSFKESKLLFLSGGVATEIGPVLSSTPVVADTEARVGDSMEMEDVLSHGIDDSSRTVIKKSKGSMFVSWKSDEALAKVFRAVVAIDFGTTRTGMLIALKKKGCDAPVIFTPNWNEGVEFAETYSVKTDCSLLLDTNGDFIAFGKTARKLAQNTYSKAYSRKRDDYWLFFEHFKMELHCAKNLDTADVTAANGYMLKAYVVFTRALEYLKEKAMAMMEPIDDLSESTSTSGESVDGGFEFPTDESEIRWVLTVPAIWSESAKDFMRKCALAAGMGAANNKPVLLYEPEAASIALQFHLQDEAKLLDVRREEGGGGGMSALIQAGDVYLIVDCGGGTVDIVAHEWIAPFEVREIIPPVGGSHGSIYVEHEFKQLLADIFGERWPKFQSERASAWLRLADACVRAKEAFHKRRSGGVDEKEEDSDDSDSDESDSECMHHIEIVDEMVDFFSKKGLKKCVKDFRKRTGENVRVIGTDRLILEISETLMASMFDKVIGQIKTLLEDLFRQFERELFGERKLRYVFVVGGFAESKYLERCIGEALVAFEGVRVLVPESPGLAVVRGAANIERIRNMVKARVLRRTYGRICNVLLSKVRRWASKPYVIDRVFTSERDGKSRVSNCFRVVARKGDCVKCGHFVTFTGRPSTALQPAVAAEVYFSDHKTEDHLLPLKDSQLLKHVVGGKWVQVPFPEWFDASKGTFVWKYTFAEESELQLEVTLQSGDRSQVVDIDPVIYHCVGDETEARALSMEHGKSETTAETEDMAESGTVVEETEDLSGK